MVSFRQVVLLLFVSALVTGSTLSAHAQFFDFFGELFKRHVRVAPQTEDLRDSATATGTTSRYGYCVRTCDGAFFPMSKVENRATPDQLCNSLCPNAETKVFFGGQIDTAVSKSGETYKKLKNAFRYREEHVANCACTRGGDGVAIIDVRADPTLKPGDIVVLDEGPRVFNGSSTFPYQTSDFSPAKLPRPIEVAKPSGTNIHISPRQEVFQAGD